MVYFIQNWGLLCGIWHKLQRCLFLNQNQTFYNSPKIAEFYKNYRISPQKFLNL